MGETSFHLLLDKTQTSLNSFRNKVNSSWISDDGRWWWRFCFWHFPQRASTLQTNICVFYRQRKGRRMSLHPFITSPQVSVCSTLLVQNGAALTICIAHVIFLIMTVNLSATSRTVFKRKFKENDSLNSTRLGKCRWGWGKPQTQ